MRSFIIRLAFLCLLWHQGVLCVLVNVSLDDTSALIKYSPANTWSQNCTTCSPQPDPGELYAGTYHFGQFDPSSNTPLFANLTFFGNAIYVFCVLAPNENSTMGFYIDNELKGNFTQSASGEYNYSVPVFHIESLPLGEHSFVLQNGIPGGIESVVLLDNIMYSTDVNSITNSSSSSPTNHSDTSRTVAAAVTVPIVAFLVTVSIVYLIRRRRLRRQITPTWFVNRWKHETVVPVSPMATWMIEPVALPPSHPASGYVNGSGRPVTTSVPSAPTSSSQQDPEAQILRPPPPSVTSASTASYGRVIRIHNLTEPQPVVLTSSG